MIQIMGFGSHLLVATQISLYHSTDGPIKRTCDHFGDKIENRIYTPDFGTVDLKCSVRNDGIMSFRQQLYPARGKIGEVGKLQHGITLDSSSWRMNSSSVRCPKLGISAVIRP